jgi:uncharacterized membrane protein YkvA (DUF1232 family)
MSRLQWAALVVGILLTGYALLIVVLVVTDRRTSARALAGFIPDCLVLFRRLLPDDRLARRHKVLVAALIAYLAMPFDLVPDFIPVAGQLDDAIAVGLVLRAVLRASGPGLVREHWPGPPRSLALLLRVAGDDGTS